MKVRYGWGVIGNQSIGDYNAYTTYRSNIYNSGYPITGSGVTIGFDAAAFGNEAAQWETTTTNNVGIGTNNPAELLDIRNSINDTKFQIANTGMTGIVTENKHCRLKL